MAFRFSIFLFNLNLIFLLMVFVFWISVMQLVFRNKQKWVVIFSYFGFCSEKLGFYLFEPFWFSRSHCVFKMFLAILLLQFLINLFCVEWRIIKGKRIVGLTFTLGCLWKLLYLIFVLFLSIVIRYSLKTMPHFDLLWIWKIIYLHNVLIQIDRWLRIRLILIILSHFVGWMPIWAILMLEELRLGFLICRWYHLILIWIDFKPVCHDLPHWIARFYFLLAIIGYECRPGIFWIRVKGF